MPFCKNCGHKIEANQRFCDNCGIAINLIDSRNDEVKNSISEEVDLLRSKLQTATSEYNKIQIIRSFLIINDESMILDFMTLASLNFDERYYIQNNSKNNISEAWLAKIEQCYQRANDFLPPSDNLNQINELYNDVINRIQKAEKEKRSKKYKTFGTIQVIIGCWTIGVIATSNHKYLGNPRPTVASLLILISGILTFFYVKHENLRKPLIGIYTINMILNLIFTTCAEGHLWFFCLYVYFILNFVLELKREQQKEQRKKQYYNST